MANAVRTRWLPRSVMLFRPADNAEEITALAPFTEVTVPIDGNATAYVCRDFACALPVHEVDALLAVLDES
jgi:uncharacterized protein